MREVEFSHVQPKTFSSPATKNMELVPKRHWPAVSLSPRLSPTPKKMNMFGFRSLGSLPSDMRLTDFGWMGNKQKRPHTFQQPGLLTGEKKKHVPTPFRTQIPHEKENASETIRRFTKRTRNPQGLGPVNRSNPPKTGDRSRFMSTSHESRA